MKKIINFLFLIGVITLSAQNKLSGKITDNNNTPLTGVEIYSSELHRGTTSDIDGNYVFYNIPNGNIKIRFVHLGFKDVLKTFLFNSKNQQFNLQLEESVFTIDEVIISTPFNKLQSENVMKVDRMTAVSMKKLGATTLIEGLSSISGVTQISTGTSIGKPVIRGLSGNRVLVYAQGIRLENQQFGGEHGLGVNDEGVESVEVIKGPASLLYGSDALGGVIYLNPEKFAINNKNTLSFNQRFFSNTLGSTSSIAYKTSLDTWKFLARATTNFHSDYKTPLSKRVTNTRSKENDFKVGISYTSPKYSSEFRYNFNRSLLGTTEGIGVQSTETSLEAPYQKINNHIFSLHNHFFFKNSKIDADIGYIYNDRNEFEEVLQFANDIPVLQMKLKTLSSTIKYHLPVTSKGLETIFGIQGMLQTNKNFGEELLIPNATVNDIGIFGTFNYQWEESSIQSGLRYDTRFLKSEKHIITDNGVSRIFNSIDKKYNSFTASFGYKFLLFDNITTRINTATGFRAPNLAELTSNGVHEGTNRYENGNSDLKNEKNFQLDIALEYKNDHFEIFGNAFRNTITDYIFLSPDGTQINQNPVYNYLQNNAILYGGEFGFHLHPHPIDWLHVVSSFEMVIGKQENKLYLPLIPANSFKNTIKAEFDIQKWLQEGYASFSFNTTLRQDNISQFETTTPGYTLLNLGFGGTIHLKTIQFETTLSIKNILDKKYINHLSRLKPDGILNIGRNIILGVSFKI